MIASGQTIRKLCEPVIDRYDRVSHSLGRGTQPNPNILITPFVERCVVNGRSYGLSHAGYDIRVNKFKVGSSDHDTQSIRMQNGDFILASSLERIKMPPNMMAIVHDKSSWAREGLALQNTVLEPGREGYITLELSFHRPAHHCVIHRGDPIAQIIFHYLDEPAERLYEGKYQNQPDEPVEAIKETNQ